MLRPITGFVCFSDHDMTTCNVTGLHEYWEYEVHVTAETLGGVSDTVTSGKFFTLPAGKIRAAHYAVVYFVVLLERTSTDLYRF